MTDPVEAPPVPTVDTCLVIDGVIRHRWCLTEAASLDEPPEGELVEFEPGTAFPSMTWDGESLALPAPPLSAVKMEKRTAIMLAFGAAMAAGAPLTFAPAESIQILTVQDQLNWQMTELRLKAAKALLGEASAATHIVSLGFLPFRCTSNAELDPTVDQALEAIAGAWSYGVACTRNTWTLKNKLDGLNGEPEPMTAAEVEAIDENAGWPA